MALTQGLQQRQSQTLAMTQQLQQSIKLLQLSSTELQAFVETELEKNPLLARDDTAQTSDTTGQQESRDIAENANEQLSDSVDVNVQERSEALDSNYDANQRDNEVAGDGYHAPSGQSAGSHDRTTASSHSWENPDYSLENTLSSDVTLQEHLLQQLHCDVVNPAQRLIGSQLIGLLDDSGYLREDTVELAELLGADAADIEATIQNLQRFDPAGVFARDLKECIVLQLKDRGHYDPAIAVLVEHIELVGAGELDRLCSVCDVSNEDFQHMLAEIRTLNPHPASDFTSSESAAVIPDVFVRATPQGTWQVELNHDILPKVLLDQTYAAELNSSVRKKEEKSFVSEQVANANWLVKALDQRAQSILKITTEIVRQQEAFFKQGIRHLKPLTLKDIAAEVDVHESTVSRVTTAKFMHTPRGIFELKYFFTSSVGSSKGADDVSSKTVMFYIQEFIDAEPADAILSDDMLVRLLKGKGVDIARRTVAKYREALNIPSSVVRRRQKKTAS